MQIYINRNGQQLGPFDEAKIKEMLRSGQLSTNDFAIKQGQQNWQKVSEMFPGSSPVGQFSPPSPVTPNGKSNGLKYGLMGCGGLFLCGLIGFVVLLALSGKRKEEVNIYNNNANTQTVSNSSNTNLTPTGTPDLYKEDSDRRTAFEPREAEFIKLPAKVQLTKQPYIKGKIAFYNQDIEVGDKDKFWLLDNSFASPTSTIDSKVNDIKAKTPDEVETVVLRNCNQYKKGNYVAGGKTIPGYNWNCMVTIVDRSIPAVIFKKSFAGKLDEVVKISASDTEIEAYIPYTEIADFIGGLPRK